MDKKNVLKSICQNLFAQNRAALGDLRNFFGHKNIRCIMVRQNVIYENISKLYSGRN